MPRKIILQIYPDKANDSDYVFKRLLNDVGLRAENINSWEIVKRSIDARKKRPQIRLEIDVFINDLPKQSIAYRSTLKSGNRGAVHIIGAGPAGYFAALKLLENGVKPIIYERGKDVQARRRDLRQIQQFDNVNPDSNYCFGEGGAGTYSDGKLYTRAKKRGDVQNILKILQEYGAPADIQIDAHPHIGSNKLPKIIQAIRNDIESKGGEIHFNARLTDFIIEKGILKAVVINDLTEFPVNYLILATGHSARDIYNLLVNKNVKVEAKPFAMGVRIEHPQALIDQIQYRQKPRELHLPAAKYSLSCQINGAGVFSFCMCPGGFIVPAATAPGELVVNGMSLSKRDSPFANSGMVVSVGPEQYGREKQLDGLEAVRYQSKVEQAIFQFNESASQAAPAQGLLDFLNGRLSQDTCPTSYIPGVYSARLDHLLPEHIVLNLKEGLKQFGKRMKGYLTKEAQLIGLESRTSAPVRIPRDKESLEHTEIKGLYPCGEGAGYAGGIMSAAMDGQRVAFKIAQKIIDQ